MGSDDLHEEPQPTTEWRHLCEVHDQASEPRQVKPLLSDEHFSVDNTLIEPWAWQKTGRRAAMTSAAAACHAPDHGHSDQGCDQRRGLIVQNHAIHGHRLGYVLNLLLAKMLELEIQLALDLVVDIASEADSAGLGQALQAGREARAERSSPSFYVNFCCKIGPEA
jgi:hypothetical protein